jgi:hypothetical protein
LRLSDQLIEADIQDHVDLHSTQPWTSNSRVADLGSGGLLETRLGVYVHWTLPEFYRTGYSAAGDAAANPTDQAERQRRVRLDQCIRIHMTVLMSRRQGFRQTHHKHHPMQHQLESLERHGLDQSQMCGL